VVGHHSPGSGQRADHDRRRLLRFRITNFGEELRVRGDRTPSLPLVPLPLQPYHAGFAAFPGEYALVLHEAIESGIQLVGRDTAVAVIDQGDPLPLQALEGFGFRRASPVRVPGGWAVWVVAHQHVETPGQPLRFIPA
jgi:hypothetical protein